MTYEERKQLLKTMRGENRMLGEFDYQVLDLLEDLNEEVLQLTQTSQLQTGRMESGKVKTLWRERNQAKGLQRFALQHSYQDEGWKESGESFGSVERAKNRAWEQAADAVIYGMVRVVNIETDEIVVTYAAGENEGQPRPR